MKEGCLSNVFKIFQNSKMDSFSGRRKGISHVIISPLIKISSSLAHLPPYNSLQRLQLIS